MLAVIDHHEDAGHHLQEFEHCVPGTKATLGLMKEQPTHQSAATRGIGVAPCDAREMTGIVLAPGHWGPRKPQNRVPPRQRVAETDLSTPIGIIDDSGAKLATFEILLPGSICVQKAKRYF
jgi:hypothetical protein